MGSQKLLGFAEEPSCWMGSIAESSILCPHCGPTHVRNVWDSNPIPYRFECITCGALGTTYFGPLRFVFDENPTMTNPKKHPLWQAFVNWGNDNCISFDHEDDWLDWWKCFLAGANANEEET